MQNVTKIPFFSLVTLWYPGGDINTIYILSKSQGLVAAKPYPPTPFWKKTNIFSLFILFCFTFQDENSQSILTLVIRYLGGRRGNNHTFYGDVPLKDSLIDWMGFNATFSSNSAFLNKNEHSFTWKSIPTSKKWDHSHTFLSCFCRDRSVT